MLIKLIDDDCKLLYEMDKDNEYVLKLSERERGKKISILSDTMLKAMFQNSNRLKYSAKFLSYFIDVSYEELLANMKLSKNELDKEKEFSKGERADYIAIIGDTSLNIEVNNNSSSFIMERNMEYATRQYTERIKRGKDKDDNEYEYKQVLQFNLNNFAFKENDKIIDICGVQNREGIRLNNKIIFIQIYVPNLRKKWYTEGIESLSEREKFILALVEENLKELEKFKEEDIVMDEYIKEAEDVSFESNIGESYDKEWALKDQALRDGYLEGKEQGIEEGIEEGKKENQKEIVLKLLHRKMNINEISDIVGLSIDELKKIQNELN